MSGEAPVPLADTTVELDFDKQPDCHPRVVVRILDKATGRTLGEAYFNPDRAEELASCLLRHANNIRHWINA